MRKILALLNTTPGTLADDIGTTLAILVMTGAVWLFWVATP